MLLITCPCCGPRDVTEFTYSGDASRRRPADPSALDDAQWEEFLYLRDNPRGPHEELWQHSAGCRRFIRVRRDTLTHEIAGTGVFAAEARE